MVIDFQKFKDKKLQDRNEHIDYVQEILAGTEENSKDWQEITALLKTFTGKDELKFYYGGGIIGCLETALNIYKDPKGVSKERAKEALDSVMMAYNWLAESVIPAGESLLHS